MTEIVNIAAYKFVTLDGLVERREQLRSLCDALAIKGTILLAPEGINLFLAGGSEAIESFLKTLRSEGEFADLEVKESPSDRQPFTRMLVRIKREIIAFGVAEIDPVNRPAPRVSARELKSWLDEGRAITLLDTRNEYEIELGTFKDAKAIGVDEFRDFPQAVARLPEQMKKETLVTFCTGGIRCEKAAPYLQHAGFESVYQLDGGILKYFEECGGAHYDGDCFVFDQRVSVSPALEETDATRCFCCQANLVPEDLKSERYVPGECCPQCWRSPAERMAMLLEKRTRKCQAGADPLPGSIPYLNRRPMSVPAKFDRATVIDFLMGMKTIHSRDEWLNACARGAVRMKDLPVDSTDVLRSGMRLEHVTEATVEPAVNPDLQFLYEDDSLVVLSKPAPLPMHPCGRFNRNTLQYMLGDVYPSRKLRPAHRLDANTSGVVICAKTRAVAAKLQPQFESGTVRKKYLTRVVGLPVADEFESTSAISREPIAAGGRTLDPAGLSAHTRFRILSRQAEGSILEAMPLTGRTNQIRIHLWGLGHPVSGDPLYLTGNRFGTQQTLHPGEPPLCLHASEIEFEHPTSDRRVSFKAPDPEWFDG
jgi:UPF0176 protein